MTRRITLFFLFLSILVININITHAATFDINALNATGLSSHPGYSNWGTGGNPGTMNFYVDLVNPLSEVNVVVSTDHFTGNLISFDVWGTNNLTNGWNDQGAYVSTSAVMNHADDFSTIWSFASSFQYIGLRVTGAPMVVSNINTIVPGLAEFDSITAVPEPSTLLMFGAGMLSFIAIRRTKPVV